MAAWLRLSSSQQGGAGAGGNVPKQYRTIAGAPAIHPTLLRFLRASANRLGATGHPSPGRRIISAPYHFEKAAGANRRRGDAADFGARGVASVSAHAPELVLIHDAARLLDRRPHHPSKRARSTAPRCRASPHRHREEIDDAAMVTETLDRSRLRMVQTPQAFAFAPSSTRTAARRHPPRHFYRATGAPPNGPAIASACSLARPATSTAGPIPPAPELYARRRSAMCARETVLTCTPSPTADMLMLGGIRIPHARGPTGRCVALHALVDAILGSPRANIHATFPPHDPQWRGASSDRFLAFACARVGAAAW